MSPRARINLAWFLRGIAQRINAAAERLDPIKLNRPIFTSHAGRASYDEAVRIIERAMAGEPTEVRGETHRAARR